MTQILRCGYKLTMIAVLVTAVAGCTSLQESQRGYVDKVGTYPLTARNEVEVLDLAEIVREHIGEGRNWLVKQCELTHYSAAQARQDEQSATPGRRLDEALSCFAVFAEQSPERAARVRNQIQERLLAASEQRCSNYKMYVQRSQSQMSFASGTFTSLFAAAGAITKSIEGAKTLAGLSGLSSAVGAEYNQAYFANLAAHVIAAGIDRQRARIYEQIYTNGQSQPIDKYALQAAIRDAFHYHGACTMTSGLIEAQDAIRVADNPGLDALRRAVVKNKHLQALTTATPGEVIGVIEHWKDVLPPDRWLAGVPMITSTRPVPNEAAQAVNLFAEQSANTAEGPATFKTEVETLAKKKAKLLKSDAAAGKLATGYVVQVTGAGVATGKQLDKCKAPVLATASKLIEYAATRAPMAPGKNRDKLDIDISYAKAEQTKQTSEISRLAANLNRCIAAARGAMLTIDQIADDATQTVIDTALKPLPATLATCTAAAAQVAGDACP